jgi:hypothetical protein
MSTPDGERFDARSPVGRYWLMHGVGFTVRTADGRRLGVVDEVLCDSVRQRAQRVTLRRPGLGRLLGRTTLVPSLVEAVVPESKLFIVGGTAGEARTPRRRRVGSGDAGASVGRALARLGALLALVAANVRPLAGWLQRQCAAALRFTGRSARRGARSVAAASVAAAAWTRREAPHLEAWLAARARASALATKSSLRALGGAARVASARLAADTRVAGAHAAAGARATARALREAAVLAAVFVSDTWKQATERAPAPSAPPPAPPQAEPDEETLEDLDAPLAREASARRRRAAAAPPANRKRST